MLQYAVKRLALVIPVVLIVSCVAFFLSDLAPGDIIEDHLALAGQDAPGSLDYAGQSRLYGEMARQLGRDQPLFYFQVVPRCFPDTLHHIVRKDERRAARSLVNRYGNWTGIQVYRQMVLRLIAESDDSPGTKASRAVVRDLQYLLVHSNPDRIQFYLRAIVSASAGDRRLERNADMLRSQWNQIPASRPRLASQFPKVIWHGSKNQYHIWLTGVMRGDFGKSIVDGRPVGPKIMEALGWTLRINIIAILLAFTIGIALGVHSSLREGKLFDKITSGVLFAFFAIPSFWLATLFVVFLTTPEYGSWTDWFPTAGLGRYFDTSGFWPRTWILTTHLFLPVLCLTLGTLAYITRQMRGSMIIEMRKDYLRLSRARGFSASESGWRHAFRNALFPIFTLVGSAIPASISGSVIIEVIFNIPGMGRLLYQSILSQDWTVVFGMLLIAAVLTVIGYLVSDLLYRRMDPRLRKVSAV